MDSNTLSTMTLSLMAFSINDPGNNYTLSQVQLCSVSYLIYYDAECCHAESFYAEFHYDECCCTECYYGECHYASCGYDENPCA